MTKKVIALFFLFTTSAFAGRQFKGPNVAILASTRPAVNFTAVTGLTFVQSTGAVLGSVVTAVETFNAQPAAGNMIEVKGLIYKNGTVADMRLPMDNCGNTYVFVSSIISNSTRIKEYVWYAKNIATCANFTITVGTGAVTDSSLNVSGMSTIATEYSGASQSAPFVNARCGSGSGTTASAGNQSVVANGLITESVTHEGANVTITPGSGFTDRLKYEDGTTIVPITQSDQGSGGGLSAGTINAQATFAASQNWVICSGNYTP